MRWPMSAKGVRRSVISRYRVRSQRNDVPPPSAPSCRERGTCSVPGEIVRFEDSYRFYYLLGPAGIIVSLAEQLD